MHQHATTATVYIVTDNDIAVVIDIVYCSHKKPVNVSHFLNKPNRCVYYSGHRVIKTVKSLKCIM